MREPSIVEHNWTIFNESVLLSFWPIEIWTIHEWASSWKYDQWRVSPLCLHRDAYADKEVITHTPLLNKVTRQVNSKWSSSGNLLMVRSNCHVIHLTGRWNSGAKQGRSNNPSKYICDKFLNKLSSATISFNRHYLNKQSWAMVSPAKLS